MALLDIPASQDTLYNRIASALPKDSVFHFHHISTPPTKCDPLFAPPPGRKPDRTYCETHFLTVSAPNHDGVVLLFALEVLVFTTRRLTTIFVSKADSTGCLASLNHASRSRASIVRTVSSKFLDWLVEHRQRPKVRLMISLFARAQGQYLFPCSVENKGKHVLDDRQLIRWWCKTLDPVLRRSPATTTSQAYVIVPGFDKVETNSFFPPSWRQDPAEARKWQFGHPLETIAAKPNCPPRCLVPHFPDDPKARYLDDLDEEIPDASGANTIASPSKKGNGMWKSIKTLAQFWEMMAFRQECSAGRMVGFIWAVFTPPGQAAFTIDDNESVYSAASVSPRSSLSELPLISEVMSRDEAAETVDRARKAPRRPLTGPVIPRPPRIKKASTSLSLLTMKEDTPFWRWPQSGRAQVVVDKTEYTRIHDLLLKLDFSNDAAARHSTTKWLEEAGTIVGLAEQWGTVVVGKLEENGSPAASQQGIAVAKGTEKQPNDLSASLVRKKRKVDHPPPLNGDAQHAEPPPINVLAGGLVRKKQKT